VVGRVSTQLGDYYDALHAMKEQELTALAEAHAEDPKLLSYRFRKSVEAVESRAGIDEPFHDSNRKDPGSPECGDVKSTIAFASYLCDGHTCTVKGEEALAFRYIDREIFPGRTTADRARGPRRSLDLLLANDHDRMPVLAELKIGGDKPAYFALIQVLMLAAEFQSPAQRARLLTHERGKDLSWAPEGPFADVYIIAVAPPKTGRYRERSFNATKRISDRLMVDAGFARYIRRIAYLEASVENCAMVFEKRFAFGPGI
jgi:hypothetical protein